MSTSIPAPAHPLSPATLEELRARVDMARLPRHVAVIMDGNGRWARQQGWLDRVRGHEAGIASVRAVTQTAARLGIEAVTLYAFSTENWARPRHEVGTLMGLLRRFLVDEIAEMNEHGIRLVASGQLSDLPADVRRQLEATQDATRANSRMVLNLALSYGGRHEIVEASRRLAADVQAGRLTLDQIDAGAFAQRLYRPELPDPDLLIRTSGEMRISNFLLWQIAYTEIHITPVLWPDFREEHFLEAIVDFQRRERRFGKVAPASASSA